MKVPKLAVCLLLGALLSIAMGQDISWDIKNYHLYNAWAFLHDRHSLDIAAAGLQTYFNPLPDLPYFYLATGPLQDWPRLLAGLQGLWFGALLFVVVGIANRFATLQGRNPDWTDLCAALVGVTGTIAVSQAGSTSNEVPLAMLVLLGLYLLMPALSTEQFTKPLRRATFAGMACGLAAGLKPTAIVYVPATAIALLLALGIRRRSSWQAVACYGSSALVVFLAVYGPWGWHLYHATGNPIFPLFNHWFESPLTAPSSLTDHRFRPRSVLQWLFYPFYWATRQHNLVTEVYFADPRYAMAMLALLMLAFGKWLRPPAWTADQGRATRFLVTFVVVGYVTWLLLFSILRYAIPLEALTGVVVFHAIRTWAAPRLPSKRWVAVLLVLILGASIYPNWWRGSYREHVIEADLPRLPPQSLVVLAGTPDAYLATLFPDAQTLKFVGITWFTRASQDHGIYEQTARRLKEQAGPIYVVLRDDTANENEMPLLNEMLEGHSTTDCMQIRSSMESGRNKKDYALGLRLCRLVRETPAPQRVQSPAAAQG